MLTLILSPTRATVGASRPCTTANGRSAADEPGIVTNDTATPLGKASTGGEPAVCQPSVSRTTSGATVGSRGRSAPANRSAAARSVLLVGGNWPASANWA